MLKVKPIGKRHDPSDGPCVVCNNISWKTIGKKNQGVNPGEYFQNYTCKACGMEIRTILWKLNQLDNFLSK